jgi:hypothetical protein
MRRAAEAERLAWRKLIVGDATKGPKRSAFTTPENFVNCLEPIAQQLSCMGLIDASQASASAMSEGNAWLGLPSRAW